MEADDLLRHACDALEKLNIAYLVTGSTATVAYGEPRFTNDIDIVLDLKQDQITAFCDAFPANDFYVSEEAMRTAVNQKHQFNVIHPGSGLKIDFILLTDSDFDQTRRKRGRKLSVLSGRTVSFASPEDVIIKKMVYYREGGSEKHLRDIGGVIRIQGDALDVAYIDAWANKLDLTDVWEAVRERQNNP